MHLVVEEEDSRCSCFTIVASIRHYRLSLKDMALKHMASHNNNSDSGHTQSEKNMKITSVCPSKSTNKKEKERNNGYCKVFCVTRKHSKWVNK